MNVCILVGRLVRDPENRTTQGGTAVTNFTIAVDRRQAKDKEKEADFIDIVTWQKLAENCAYYLSKGKMVAVEGKLQIRSYEDSQGVKRKVAEVVANNVQFLSPKDSGGNSSTSGGFNAADVPFKDNPFSEDDVPF